MASGQDRDLRFVSRSEGVSFPTPGDSDCVELRQRSARGCVALAVIIALVWVSSGPGSATGEGARIPNRSGRASPRPGWFPAGPSSCLHENAST